MTKKSQKTVEQTIAKRRAEIAKHMHVPKMKDGYHILEIPGRKGEPYEFWPGPFRTERGAKLFLDVLLNFYAEGDPEQALDYPGRCEGYDEQAGVLTFLEKQEDISNLRALASELCRMRPWNGFAENGDDPFEEGTHDSEIPF